VEYEITPITDDNYFALNRVISTAFGEEDTEQRAKDERTTVELDRMLGVSDGGQLVASAGAFSFELTLPGARSVPVAGVTWVGCLASHRRRGVLTAMMRHQLDDVAARGEPLATLTASEAVIYGRFGYGAATQHAGATIEIDRAAFAAEPRADGRFRYVWGDERTKVLAPVFDAWRRQVPGAVTRNERYWEYLLLDRDWMRRGASSLFFVVHEDATGVADGYASYRVASWESDDHGTAFVQEVIALDPEVDAALWRFVLDLDLMKKVKADVLPMDSPLPWRLRDWRAYKVTDVSDFLWVRVLDTVAALSARRYATEDALVVDVVDPFRPDGAAAGRFRVAGGPDWATCERVDGTEDADITGPVDALGAAYLGGVRWTTLAAAGRVTGSPDALTRADRMFASTPLPFCNTGF
jgi:predicted acetyltransferase